jgi:hypothetical protein
MTVVARPPASLGRRGLLVGGLGLLTTACRDGSSDASPATPTSSGPIIQQQDAGNVISTEDVDRLVGQLNTALREGDVASMKAVAPDLHVPEWERRLGNIARFPMSSVGFQFDDSYDRQVNASGGPLDIDANVVLTHRIADVDSREVVQVYRFGLAKAAPDAEVHITEIRGPYESASPAPWDLTDDWDVLVGDHVVLTARSGDMGRARAALPSIDAGAAAAMDVIAPPQGVSKVFIALADPGSPLYNDGDTTSTVTEALGVAYRAGYIDPEEAASSGKGAGAKAPYASSRLLLHPSAFESSDLLRGVALHESIHAMAFQWGDGDPWPTEGLARWAEAGFAAGLRGASWRDSIRSGFAGFASRMGGHRYFDYDVFHQSAYESVNYNCAAAVYGYLESDGGRDEALRFARLAYGKTLEEAVEALGFADQAALFDRVQGWVDAL